MEVSVSAKLETFLPAGTKVIVAGWGRTKDDPTPIFPEFLQALQVKVIDWNECKRRVLPFKLQTHHICAGLPVKGKGSCRVNF